MASKLQAPVSCKLCETETKINWKCYECDLLMCDRCKEKIHPNIRNARDHKVLNIREVGEHSTELDFSSIKCEEHSGQYSCLFCKKCDNLVCPVCVSKIHNGHELVEIRTGYEIKEENLKQGQKRMQSVINELDAGEMLINEKQEAESSNCKELHAAINDHKMALKKAIDELSENLLKKVDQKWQTLEDPIQTEQNRIIIMKKQLKKYNARVEDMKTSGEAAQFFKKDAQLDKAMNETFIPLDLATFETMPKFLPGEITIYNVGSFRNVSNKTDVKLAKQFVTDVQQVHYLSIMSDNSLWISCTTQGVLQYVKFEGNRLKVIANVNLDIFGMAVSPTNNVILVTNGAKLKQINASETPEDSKYSIHPLQPISLHITSDGKMLVGGWSKGPAFPVTGRRVVIMMDKEGVNEIIMDLDKNGKPLFSYPLDITSTRNGNIFVVDRLSNDSIGRVVVLSQNGELLHLYTGSSDTNTKRGVLKPERIVATGADNVILSDMYTNTLHFLNNSGLLIMIFETSDMGIIFPMSMCFNTAGQLYVGCSNSKGSSDNAKLFQLNISEH